MTFRLKWENVEADTELRLSDAEIVEGDLPEEGGAEWGIASLLAHVAATQLRVTVPHSTVEIEGHAPDPDDENDDSAAYAQVRVS